MPRTSTCQRALATGALLLIAACHDAATPTSPVTPPEPIATRQGPQVPDPATLARTIPGFGGLYLDDGVPTVYLTDVSRRGAAEAVLAGYGFPGARVVQGRYAHRQLERWFHDVSRSALEQSGVVFVDLDEASNRVLVGVEHARARAAARGLITRLGIPGAAIAIQETEPIHFVQTLRSKVRPVEGGLQIRFSGFLCTLSFIATRPGEGGFVTASHCSDRQGAVDGTLYYQPLNRVADEFIGTEVADPAFFRKSQGCPPGRRCRHSDANLAQGASGVAFALGRIARTTAPNNGSLTLDGAFSIKSEAPGNALVGETLNKVGRTTGWTQGVVTNSCVNTGVFGTNIVLLCQDFVSAGVGGGDSGSPVFGITEDGHVRLNGTLWGGNSAGTLFVYSPIANIERELGPLTTH